MLDIDILNFMKETKFLAHQALGAYAGAASEGGFVRWKHVVIHCYRLEADLTYRATELCLELFSELREILTLISSMCRTLVRSTRHSTATRCRSGGRYYASQPSNTPIRARCVRFYVLRSRTGVGILSNTLRSLG